MVRPFRGSTAVEDGRLTEAQLRTRAWRRLFRDVYVLAEAEITHLVRCEAAALILPPDAAISGASAAYLHGADVLNRNTPVEVTVLRQIRTQPGLIVRRSVLCASDIVEIRGLPVTSLVRTASDVGRWRDTREAVVALDGLLGLGRLSLKDVQAYGDMRRSWPGTRRLTEALSLTARGAESPMESRLRLVLRRAGLPEPVLQYRVYDAVGLFVARLDLAYVPERLGIEYDGGCHFDARSLRKDLRRQNALRAVGWSLFRFTSEDVTRHPDRLAVQVRAALCRV